MKKLIIIPFLLLTLIVSATNYYVKNGGDNTKSGLDDVNAWETIAKVNSVSFNAGDNIYFKKGDIFIGTLTPASSGTFGNYITFGAYGTGVKPILTPNNVVAGITWTVHSGDIWKTTDIPYNPGNILIDWEDKIPKINDANWTTAYSGHYGGLNSLGMLALSENQTYNINDQDVYFWDGLDALYAYNSGTTYLRFRGGEDPNDSTFMIAAEGSSAIYLYYKNYINIQNLHLIGGQYGIDLYTAGHIIIENCYIGSSNNKIYIHASSSAVTVRNDTLTNNYLSSYTPGAWVNGTEYVHGVNEHYYIFGKYRIGHGDSNTADNAIFMTGGKKNNNTIHDNIITDCINGIYVFGDNNHIYNNYIEGTSSIGVYFNYGTDSCSAYNNHIVNSNIPFRFGWVDNTTYTPRRIYIYRNKIDIIDAGEFMYIHYGTTGAAAIQAFIYHNSIIGKRGITLSSYAAKYPDDDIGFLFVNNIFSILNYNSYGWSGMATHDDLFVFYYNWVGGYYYGAGSGVSVWATDASNLNHVGSTFWDHEIDPPDFTDIIGTEVVDAGIDVSTTFVLDEVEYPALPGTDPGDYYDDPDIGYYEYDAGGGPIEPLVIFTTTIYPHDIWALAGGNVYYDGGGTVDQRGVCWSESENPTITDSHTSNGSGTGVYTSTITGLEENTTYFCRAYAHNEIGYGYGSQIEFTTTTETIITHGGKIVFHNGKIKVRK